MRRLPFTPVLLLLVLLLVIGAPAAVAEEAQRQLDPNKPADAVEIIHRLTEKMTLPRDQAVALTVAIETLGKLAMNQAKAAVAPPPPTESPDKKPKK